MIVITEKEAVQTIGDGRLVFMSSTGEYRVGDVIIPSVLVSALLGSGLIERAGSMAGVYRLSEAGKEMLKDGR